MNKRIRIFIKPVVELLKAKEITEKDYEILMKCMVSSLVCEKLDQTVINYIDKRLVAYSGLFPQVMDEGEGDRG